jgi:hypothetical protein
MIGKIDRTTNRSVIVNPEVEARRRVHEDFSPGASRGIANITRYARANATPPALCNN